MREAHGAAGKIHRPAKAHADRGWPCVAQQIMGQREYRLKFVARVGIWGREDTPVSAPLALTASYNVGGVFGTAKVESQE